MEIDAIDAAGAMRRVFAAAEERRWEVFEREVMEPFRPVWEQAVRYGGQAPAAEGAAMTAAGLLKLYTPAMGAGRGVAALDLLERAETWEACLSALRRAIDALQPKRHGLSLDRVRFVFTLADPDGLGEEGYTGAGNVPGWVVLSAWPMPRNLPKLPAVVVHEFNHNVRFMVEPGFPLALGQYLVLEGVAEAFAAELCGEEMLGPWATTLGAAELEALRPRFRDALDEQDFDVVRGYIFGDWAAAAWGYAPQGVPDFAGYAMGYRTVKAYLERTGKSAAEATYTPWREIVESSGYW